MTKWTIDPMHSEVHFKVKHLVISTVTGSFTKFEGDAQTASDDFINASIHFAIDAASVDTNQPQRDEHLRSADFFDAGAYPKIDFISTSMTQKSGSEYLLKGNITIKGITKPIELPVEFGGIAKDSYGNTKAGFEIQGVINRKDFGLTWGPVNEAGGLMLGEDVKLVISVQLAKLA